MKGISGEGDYQRNGRYCAWRSFAGLPQTKRPEQSTISSHLRSPAVLRPDVVANIARKGYKRLEIDLENRYSGTDRAPRLNKAIDINCSIHWRRQSRCVVVDDIYTYIYIYWAEKEKRTRGKKKKKEKKLFVKSLLAYNICMHRGDIARERHASFLEGCGRVVREFFFIILTHSRPKALWRNEIFKSSRPSILWRVSQGYLFILRAVVSLGLIWAKLERKFYSLGKRIWIVEYFLLFCSAKIQKEGATL